jgi:hypothetical protein
MWQSKKKKAFRAQKLLTEEGDRATQNFWASFLKHEKHLDMENYSTGF